MFYELLQVCHDLQLIKLSERRGSQTAARSTSIRFLAETAATSFNNSYMKQGGGTLMRKNATTVHSFVLQHCQGVQTPEEWKKCRAGETWRLRAQFPRRRTLNQLK
jgi:hypothetical protein